MNEINEKNIVQKLPKTINFLEYVTIVHTTIYGDYREKFYVVDCSRLFVIYRLTRGRVAEAAA